MPRPEGRSGPGAAGDPGPLLASGRAADVFDLGDGTVLRLYRTERDCGVEGRVMTWLGDVGVRVPEVHSARGREMVMEPIPGPTMLEEIGRRPWTLAHHARSLARLQRDINDLEAPAWFPTREGVPPGTAVLHLVLHPMNVLLGPDGPVVIDWTNAARGAPSFDAAMTYVLGSTSATSDLSERIGRRAFLACFSVWRGRRDLRAPLRQAAAHRLGDPNLTDGERRSVEQLLVASPQSRLKPRR